MLDVDCSEKCLVFMTLWKSNANIRHEKESKSSVGYVKKNANNSKKSVKYANMYLRLRNTLRAEIEDCLKRR